MPERLHANGRQPARLELKPYAEELPLGSLAVGVDNIHHDVYLSPQWTEQTRTYLLELIRQIANLSFVGLTPKGSEHAPWKRQTLELVQESRAPKGPEHASWKRQTLELVQASLTRAKYEKKIELDLLLRLCT